MAGRLTLRDLVWDAALRLAMTEERFKIDTLIHATDLERSQRKTIRRVLNTMTELGWLEHEKWSEYYQRGQNVEHLIGAESAPDAVTIAREA